MGFANLILICIFLFCPGVAVAGDCGYSHHTSHPADGNWIELWGENSVMVPTVNLTRPAVRWTYPYSVHPIYHHNQTINATFFGAQDLANGTIKVFVDDLHYSSFMGAVDVLDSPANLTAASGAVGPYKLNSTGDASFAIPGMPSGIYSIYVIYENSSIVLSASPLLVTETDIRVETPPEIFAGDFIPVNIELNNGSEGRPLVFGAFIVSDQDYRALSLNISGDGTINGTLINLTWNENALEIEGDFHPNWDLFAKLLMIFPANSAASMQDSVEGKVELFLITEDYWAPGTYVLTCCVLSDGAVVGLNQTEVVIV